VLQCVAACRSKASRMRSVKMSVLLQRVAACCSVLQCVAVCCSVLKCGAVVLQCEDRKQVKRVV